MKIIPLQEPIFENLVYPSYEQLLEEYSKEYNNYIKPQGDTVFGFWMQTLADLELLDLELQGLTDYYKIEALKRIVELKGNYELIRLRISHLEKVKGKKTLYCEFIDRFGDTNAYAFHNLYPYKGKFYPRVVRTLINAFKLNENSLILDPFNGSGTTTHEASLMGIKSVGIDVTPMGIILSELKNDLLFLDSKSLDFNISELEEIFSLIENKKWVHKNSCIQKLMLTIYFDTLDAFARTNRYNRKGIVGLFADKFNYIKKCFQITQEIKDIYSLNFVPSKIIESDVLELSKIPDFQEKFDACITSPPYYFSIDYVGKDKIAYEYMGIEMKRVESKYLGMKSVTNKDNVNGLPGKVVVYYEDLKKSLENIYWALKPSGKLAIVIGDSTVNGKKIPTTATTRKFCEEIGFKFIKLIFNPLLGARNRAIRGESIILFEK